MSNPLKVFDEHDASLKEIISKWFLDQRLQVKKKQEKPQTNILLKQISTHSPQNAPKLAKVTLLDLEHTTCSMVDWF